ncbi:MAG: amidohydrolase family protein [Chitinophagaceae bacterium]|nr:amidohydrolase family protein [Chitinophagaceae bacterium]
MRIHLLLLLLPVCAIAQPAPPPADSATFLLHKFAQNIGKETYTLRHTDSGLVYDVVFKFTDRGRAVPLKTRLTLTNSFEPVSLFIKGNTSRFSAINDTVRIQGRTAFIKVDDSAYQRDLAAGGFPVAGYSPGTVQMALLKYWLGHGMPESIPILPDGVVKISKDGTDELTIPPRAPGPPHKITLGRYIINGLVWGNELVWTLPDGQLVCLITNDAEGDKLEMMLEPYEALLPQLLQRAATYGMQLFSREMASLPVDKTGVSSKFGWNERRRLAIVGGTLIDVKTGAATSNSVILVEDRVIKATGKSGELVVPANYSVIHAEGKTILPGLWDMHAHFEQAEWGPAYLAAGVTTVRDCGNEYDYINAIQMVINRGNGVGPHILKAGIIDGPGPMGLGVIRASTPEEAVAAVKKYKDAGFMQIKIYSSITPPVVKAICREAHRLGMTVTGHIPEGMSLQQGIDSGMDMVNHIQYVYQAMKKGKDRGVDLTDSTNRQVLRFIKDHGTVIDPTLGVFEMVLRSTKDDITTMEPAFSTLPLPLQALFKNMGMAPDVAAQYRPMQDGMGKIVKALHDEGVPLVAGTDMGFPGFSLDRELELYVAAGLTPLEAIQTSTLIPARVMKMDKITGSITPGLQADLVIIEGDPLSRIRDIRNVQLVIKGGKIYDPKALHKLAGFGK